MFEGIIDGHELFIMNVIISFGVFEHLGVESDWMVVAIWGSNGQYCS